MSEQEIHENGLINCYLPTATMSTLLLRSSDAAGGGGARTAAPEGKDTLHHCAKNASVVLYMIQSICDKLQPALAEY